MSGGGTGWPPNRIAGAGGATKLKTGLTLSGASASGFSATGFSPTSGATGAALPKINFGDAGAA